MIHARRRRLRSRRARPARPPRAPRPSRARPPRRYLVRRRRRRTGRARAGWWIPPPCRRGRRPTRRRSPAGFPPAARGSPLRTIGAVSIAERIVSRVPAAAPLTRRTTVAPGSRKIAVGSSSESSLSDVEEKMPAEGGARAPPWLSPRRCPSAKDAHLRVDTGGLGVRAPVGISQPRVPARSSTTRTEPDDCAAAARGTPRGRTRRAPNARDYDTSVEIRETSERGFGPPLVGAPELSAATGLLLFFHGLFSCLPPARTTADGQATQRDFSFFCWGCASRVARREIRRFGNHGDLEIRGNSRNFRE